jgi:hypothetical protein
MFGGRCSASDPNCNATLTRSYNYICKTNKGIGPCSVAILMITIAMTTGDKAETPCSNVHLGKKTNDEVCSLFKG